MAKKLSPPPETAPLQIGDRLHPEWKQFFEQFQTMAATQSDAGDAAGDPPTQAEFNAAVAIINALIDKLQAANLME